MANNSSLAINNEAITKIAAMATMEVRGVAALGKRPVELKNIKSVLRRKCLNMILLLIY